MALVRARYVAPRGAPRSQTDVVQVIDDGPLDRHLARRELGVAERVLQLAQFTHRKPFADDEQAAAVFA